jgi:hypothetical protein
MAKKDKKKTVDKKKTEEGSRNPEVPDYATALGLKKGN